MHVPATSVAAGLVSITALSPIYPLAPWFGTQPDLSDGFDHSHSHSHHHNDNYEADALYRTTSSAHTCGRVGDNDDEFI